MMRRASLWVGAVIIAAVVLMALVGALWTPFDQNALVGERLQPPGWPHVLGTDGLGGDIASRMLAGATQVLIVGIVSVLGAAVVGIPLGIVAGMSKAWLGHVIARGADILYGFPALLLAILFAAALGGSVLTAMLAIGLATIPAFVRIARAGTLQVMNMAFIEAAELANVGRLAIATRHVLPNVAPLLGVQASVSFGIAILAEAGLSYLGLGSGPQDPTWGRLLREAQDHMFTQPMVALWPGLAITLATFGFNQLGDGLRDLLDPRLREVS